MIKIKKKLWLFEDCANNELKCRIRTPFFTVGHIFEALLGTQIMHTIFHFKAWEVRSPMLQTVRDLELKRKSYGCLKTNHATMHLKRRALSLRSHTKPLTPFLTSLKPSEPIAPIESSSRGDYAT